MPLTINGIEFRTQKLAMEHVRGILLQNEGEKITPMDDDYQFLDELMDRHPHRDEKIKGDIKYFRVIRNLNNALAINIYDDEGEKDISWNQCVTGKAKKVTDLLSQAMRSAISYQTQKFKLANFCEGDECINCGTVITEKRKAHTDHKTVPFIDIKNEFIASNVMPIEFRKTDRHEPQTFLKKDKVLEDKWAAFHKGKADFQILCIGCNLRKKKSKK